MDSHNPDNIDLFGDLSVEDQLELNQMNKRRQAEAHKLHNEKATPDSLEFQRRCYLWSASQTTPDSLTLKNHEPINYGQAFTPSQCQEILQSTYNFVETKGWSHQRHGAFPTRDVPVGVLSVSTMVYERLKALLFPNLEEHTGIEAKFWSFRDLFIVGYHEDYQRMLGLHTDGCLASLTLLLNDPTEFQGGGTFFEKFDMLVNQMPGDAWVHDANLRHSGVEITQGTRVIMVGFMDTVGGITE
ncbi:hypothetical protein GGF37_003198, partial [Kickxella alabastrina]